MTQQRRTALKELQKLDTRIQDVRQLIRDFDPQFEEAEEPALVLESELEKARKRLKEMTLEERRLESSSEEKQERLRRLEERVGSVRNLREEAAVSAELDMVRRAIESDESEALNLMDSVRKGDERVQELEASYEEAMAIVEPKRTELLDLREKARTDLATMEKERKAFTGSMQANELKIYDAIRGDGRRAAVAELTADGACGHCFGIVPLQHQNEVRHGDTLLRCEACGVILAAPEPVEEGADEIATDEASSDEAATDEASSEEADAEAGSGEEADAEAGSGDEENTEAG
jgi:uncharacterized protein